MSYTQLKPGMAEKTRIMIEAFDTMPTILRHCVTPEEAAEVRARVDALNSVLHRHIRDIEGAE